MSLLLIFECSGKADEIITSNLFIGSSDLSQWFVDSRCGSGNDMLNISKFGVFSAVKWV